MWTLLSAGAQRARALRNGAGPEAHAGDRMQVNGMAGATDGGGQSAVPAVRVYMHPGRLSLGAIGLHQADEQFDLRTARAFASLEEAEPACASRAGFLLELCDSATSAEHARNGVVLFVESLRS